MDITARATNGRLYERFFAFVLGLERFGALACGVARFFVPFFVAPFFVPQSRTRALSST